MYGINLQGDSSTDNPVTPPLAKTSPALAAAEVAYVSQALGDFLLGIEIGNECNRYGWTFEYFESLWEQYRSAIYEQTQGITFAGPASSTHGLDHWTIPFGLDECRGEITHLTQHYYRCDTPSCQQLVAPDPNLLTALCKLKNASLPAPLRIGECNSYSDGGAESVSNTYASTLWAIDFLFACALGGATGVNFHGGGEKKYTPIEDKTDNTGSVINVRPEYYGILFFFLATINQGSAQLCHTQVSVDLTKVDPNNVTAYAVQSSAGLILVAVNKDPEANLKLDITLPEDASYANLYQLTQRSGEASLPDLAATSGVTIQDASVGADGSFVIGDPYTLTASDTGLTCYVPALSAVLVCV